MSTRQYPALLLILGIFFCSTLQGTSQTTLPSFTPKELKIFSKRYGHKAKLRLKAWIKLIKSKQKKSNRKKLTLVNDFFNQFTYHSDIEFVGQTDYWMTPMEFIIKAGGDCEDYSIAKYFTLVHLGIPTDQLRITYVKALRLNQAHMVLAYYPSPSAEPLILDNLTTKIKKASKRKDLKPVYSFNAKSLWLNKLRGQSQRLGHAKKLKKWNSMLNRMKQNRIKP